MQLKYKILTRFTIIGVIPLIVSSIILYSYITYEITQNTLEHLESIAILEKDRIDALIVKNYERINDISSMPYFTSLASNFLSTGNLQMRSEIDNMLKKIQSTSSDFESITILNNTGDSVISTSDDIRDIARSFNYQIYNEGKRHNYLDIGQDNTGNYSLYMISPIMDNKIFLGNIVVKVKMKTLSDIIDDHTGLGQTGESILIKKDSTGNVLIMPSFQENNNGKFQTTISKSDIKLPIIHAINGHQTYFDNILDYHGKPVLAITKYFPSTGWGLVVKIDRSEAYSSIESLKDIMLTIVLIAIAISTWMSFLMAKTISDPINTLRKICRQISKGNLNVRSEVKGWKEFKELSTDINAMIISLQIAEKQKNEFGSMISHELKTPLVPIMGYCTMLSDPNYLGGLTSEQNEAIGHIQRNVKRLKNMIDAILMVQNIEMKEVRFVKKEIPIIEFMKNMADMHQLLARSKNITITNTAHDDITLKSDEDKITEVFTNLIQNAVDFVPQSGGRIEIGATVQDKDILFYVKDNGVGIPKENQANLFKKFYQIDTSIKRNHGGTGLGLVICKGIVEGLGGKIWVESEPNKETVFYFTIPKGDNV